MLSPVEHLARGLITRLSLPSCSFILLTELIYGLLQRNMYLHDSYDGADSIEHRESGRESHSNGERRQSIDDNDELRATISSAQRSQHGSVVHLEK